MHRRAFLAAATTGTASLVTGCSTRDESGGDGAPRAGGDGGYDATEAATVATPSRARPAIQESFRFEPAAGEPHDTVEIGSRESVVDPEDNLPWDVAVWNDDDAERDIDVGVYAARGRPVERTLSLPARAYYLARLLKPDRYTAQVQHADQPRYEYEIATGAFDCNEHVLRLRVSPTGLVEYQEISTAAGCNPRGTPTDAATPE